MLTLVIGAASEDIKEELEQNILYDQYDSMDEVISAVRQMTQDAGHIKAVFFCPLIGNIDEGDGDMFTVGDSYLADSADEIADALKRYTANDENDMALLRRYFRHRPCRNLRRITTGNQQADRQNQSKAQKSFRKLKNLVVAPSTFRHGK